MTMLAILLSTIVPVLVCADQVCYGSLGCFDNAGPWQGRDLPQPPEDVAARFLLFTRNAPDEWELIFNHSALLERSDFDATRQRTILILHGFADSCYQPWITALIPELLQAEDANILCVDWPFGSAIYHRARDNARLVGALGAQMISWLGATAGLQTSQVYIIGHDIGAHAAGYIGQTLPTSPARITGLDPASLDFDGADDVVRLDAADCHLVDFVLTNAAGERALGLGSSEERASVNFRPNGGATQPGCSDTISHHIRHLSDLRNLKISRDDWLAAACSHFRSTDLYLESITSRCGFVSLPCDSYESLLDGSCPTSCGFNHDCQTLGYHAQQHYKNNDTFYLKTSDAAPFCDAFDALEVSVADSQVETQGTLLGAILTKDGTANLATLASGKMAAFDIFHARYITAEPGEDLVQAQLLYTKKSSIFHDYSDTLTLSRVQATLLEGDFHSHTLSATDITLQTGVSRTVVLQ